MRARQCSCRKVRSLLPWRASGGGATWCSRQSRARQSSASTRPAPRHGYNQSRATRWPAVEPETGMADIVLINPKFEISFWGLEYALPLLGKRANMPVAALPLIAALTPTHHRVTIIDENVEAIDFRRCEEADIVGVTGMIVQRQRMRELLADLRRRKCFTV